MPAPTSFTPHSTAQHARPGQIDLMGDGVPSLPPSGNRTGSFYRPWITWSTDERRTDLRPVRSSAIAPCDPGQGHALQFAL